MNKKPRALILGILALMMPSCAYLPAFTQDEYARREREENERQYAPYKQLNTVEGYREFVKKYPHNYFLETALDSIDNLEFAPYEKADTLQAYAEFVARYPDNRHAVAAKSRIDQARIRECERVDTIEAYRQFLGEHPQNIFAQTAQDRLQDLVFRELAQRLERQHGFDLLLYRLHVKRLQAELPELSGVRLGDFTLFVTLEAAQGKPCLKSHLLYSSDISAFAHAPAALQEQLYDGLVAPLIACAARQLGGSRGIDSLEFSLSRSADRFYGNERPVVNYAVPAREAIAYGQGKIDRAGLRPRVAMQQVPQALPEAAAAGRPPVKLEGGDIMAKSAALRQARDSRMTTGWKRVNRDGTVYEMKAERTWKDFNGAGGYRSKSIMRYTVSQQRLYAAAILTAVDADGGRQYRYIFNKGDYGQTPDIDNYRPRAEWEFPLAEYTEPPPEKERHQYVATIASGSRSCYEVHSTPGPGVAPYGKKISLIDRQTLLPVKVQYFDTKGALWKTAAFDWQQSGGVWYWDRAVVENAQSGDVTTIAVTEASINPGLSYNDFSGGSFMRYSR